MPVPVAAASMSSIEQAVRKAADLTGVDFGFLMRTAKRESGFDNTAHAPTSSAAGLFQFTEQTWLATLKRHGSAHGYARYAELIQEGPDGRFVVTSREGRQAVMDLRYDPHASAVMAGELASDHAAYLRGRTGRDPTGGELYAAHFLGPQGSAKLIETVERAPATPAAALFPDAASANRGVFFQGGHPLSASQLYANLSRTGGQDLNFSARAGGDPGEGAFAAYTGAARNERLAQERELMSFIMGESGGGKSFASTMLSSEMLTLLANDAHKR